MNSGLRIPHLEDNRTDASLIGSLLRENGVACEMELVQTREAYLAALDRGGFEMVFSDFTVPSFNGLGALALAQRVIQRHGGQLWAEGRPGTGATFCFTLPHRIEFV